MKQLTALSSFGKTALVVTTLCGALLTAPSAMASSKKGDFAIKGPGVASCAEYVNSREKNQKVAGLFAGWLMGYLSAHNKHAEDTFDIAPWQQMDLLAALMHNYCKQNEKTPFIQATDALIEVLKPNRLTKNSKVITAKANGKTAQVYQETMKMVQSRLKALNLYTSGIDGQFGPGTRKAIEDYQKQSGLQVTGIPDQLTLYQLLVGKPKGTPPKR